MFRAFFFSLCALFFPEKRREHAKSQTQKKTRTLLSPEILTLLKRASKLSALDGQRHSKPRVDVQPSPFPPPSLLGRRIGGVNSSIIKKTLLKHRKTRMSRDCHQNNSITIFLGKCPGALTRKSRKNPENNSTGIYFDKSPFSWGAKAGLLPDPETNSAKIYLGNRPRGSYRVFR